MNHWDEADDVTGSNCWLPMFSHPAPELIAPRQAIKLPKLRRFEYTWFVGKKFFESYFMLMDERPHVEEDAPTNIVGFAPCLENTAHVDLRDDPFGKGIPMIDPHDIGP